MSPLRVILCLAFLQIFWGCHLNNPSKPPAQIVESLERSFEKGPVQMKIRVSPRLPRLSDVVQLEIEVLSEPKVSVQPPIFGQAVGDFIVRDYREKKGVELEAKELVHTSFVYQLEPTHAGKHLIRSIAIDFTDQRPGSESREGTIRLESDPLEIDVTSELGDAVPDLADLESMVPPRTYEESSQWFWGLALIPLLAIVGLIAFYRRRGRSSFLEVKKKSPSERAQEELANLLSENLPSQHRFQEFYLRLTGIVRFYIEGTTGIRAPEQTTEEFLRVIKSREVFSYDHSLRLREFLEAADMVKYAGQLPLQEQVDESIRRAREFVSLQPALSDPLPSDRRG